MRKLFKKAIAVVSSLAMAVAGISYSPATVNAAEWAIEDITDFDTASINGQDVYVIKNLKFNTYNDSELNDYAYGAFIDSISEDNLVRNYSADWLWGVANGGNNGYYDGVVTNNAKTIYFEAGSTHTFILAVYPKDTTTADALAMEPLATVQKTVTFPSEIIKSEETIIKEKLASEDNVALSKTAFASSQASDGYAARLVNDNNTGSRWAAGSYDSGEYVGVDLGALYSLTSVAMIWEGAYATSYDVQVSTDGTTYTTAKSVTATSAETIEVTFDSAVEAQFIRIMCNTNALPYGYSIFELGAFGTKIGEGIQLPSTPEGLVVTPDKSANLITIAFAANVTNATSYNLYVDGALVGTITNGGTIAYDSLTVGTHSIQVSSVNENGESAKSTAVSITIEGEEESTSVEETTTAEEETTTGSTPSTGGEYSDLTFYQVGSTDYYVAAIHGDVKDAFTFQMLEDQGTQMLIIPNVAAGTAPIWPNFTDATLNGNAFDQIAGAGIYLKYEDLTMDAYNVYEATSAVTNDRFQLIIKAGNPGSSTENELQISGYQANVSGITVNDKTYEGGIRVVYNKPDSVSGEDMSTATDFGLLFGNGQFDDTELVVDVPSTMIKKIQATDAGLISEGTYAVTMATNFSTASVASLSRTFSVRSYAVIGDVVYYSDVTTFSEIDVLKAIYESGTLSESQKTAYLAIIKKVDSSYVG